MARPYALLPMRQPHPLTADHGSPAHRCLMILFGLSRWWGPDHAGKSWRGKRRLEINPLPASVRGGAMSTTRPLGWLDAVVARVDRPDSLFLSGPPPSAVKPSAFPLGRCCLLVCAGNLRESAGALEGLRLAALRASFACSPWACLLAAGQPARGLAPGHKPVQRGLLSPTTWSGACC